MEQPLNLRFVLLCLLACPAIVASSCSKKREHLRRIAETDSRDLVDRTVEVRLSKPIEIMQRSGLSDSCHFSLHAGEHTDRLFVLSPVEFIVASKLSATLDQKASGQDSGSVYSSFMRQLPGRHVFDWYNLNEVSEELERQRGGQRSQPNSQIRGRPWIPDRLDFVLEPGAVYQPLSMVSAGRNLAVAWLELSGSRGEQGELIVNLIDAETLRPTAPPVSVADALELVRLHSVADVTRDGVDEIAVVGFLGLDCSVRILDGLDLHTVRDVEVPSRKMTEIGLSSRLAPHHSWVEPGRRSVAIPWCRDAVEGRWWSQSVDLLTGAIFDEREVWRLGEGVHLQSVGRAIDAGEERYVVSWYSRQGLGEQLCGWSVILLSASGLGPETVSTGTLDCRVSGSPGPWWIMDIDGDAKSELLVPSQGGGLQVQLSSQRYCPVEVIKPDGWPMDWIFYGVAMQANRAFVIAAFAFAPDRVVVAAELVVE